jgi:hypothetical protein
MEGRFTDYKTAKEASQEWDITTRQVTTYIEEKRIPGAIKVGTLWLIPKEAAKPADRRYTKNRNKESDGDQ